jgi:multiple sugar transport system permease protein
MNRESKITIEKPGSQEKLFKYLSIAPVTLFLLLVVLYPLGYALYMSLTNAHISNIHTPKFIGLTNYIRFFTSTDMWLALLRSLVYVGVTVSLETVIGMALAVALNRKVFLKRIYVILFIIPMLISPVLVGIMFRLEGNDAFGVIQQFSKNVLGLQYTLYSPQLAFSSMMLIDIWQWTSFMFLILYAGLRSLPQDPYEASAVDGASPWQTFWTVTLPLLRPVLMIALIFRVMDAFKAFDHINMLTGGGPGSRTTTISVLMYKTAFEKDKLGAACALSILFLVLINIIVKRMVIYFPQYAQRLRESKENKRLVKQLRRQARIPGSTLPPTKLSGEPDTAS